VREAQLNFPTHNKCKWWKHQQLLALSIVADQEFHAWVLRSVL